MRIEATEMRFNRRMLRISWPEYRKNETILIKFEPKRLKFRNRELRFLGHRIIKRA